MGNNVREVSGSEVSCVAITVAKTGYEDKVMLALQDLIVPVHRESGVIQYDLHRDLNDSRRFVLIERWETLADFNAHCVAPHIRDYLKLTDGWLEQAVFYPLKEIWQGDVGQALRRTADVSDGSGLHEREAQGSNTPASHGSRKDESRRTSSGTNSRDSDSR